MDKLIQSAKVFRLCITVESSPKSLYSKGQRGMNVDHAARWRPSRAGFKKEKEKEKSGAIID